MHAIVRGAFALPAPLSGAVVTVGTFDGVHRGHQTLVARAVARARPHGAAVVVYTFDPHPARVLAPAKAPPVLLSIEERARVLSALGADVVMVEPFDRAFSEISADEWVERWLVGQLAPRAVVIGFNFTYGRGRGGDAQHMTRMGQRFGFEVEVVGAVGAEGDVVSSTRLRGLVSAGEVEAVRRLCDRPFALTGVVEKGDQRGRTLGFPTANIAPEGEILPKSGVYAGHVELPDGRRFSAVCNIGHRPTFSGASVRVEAHLFDFDGDLYGQRLRLELIARLRDERRFDGLAALTAQIRDDAAQARARLDADLAADRSA
jgi:riboflavin kinase/FMN adenylyltransferase